MIFLKLIMGTLIGISLLLLVALVFIGRDRGLALFFGPVDEQKIDFVTLSLAPTPNQFLVCPKGYCNAPSDLESPVYNLSVDALKAEWMTLMNKQPRIEKGSVDSENLQYDFIQRTEWMRYPDSITVRFIPLGPTISTLAIYSRSHYGKDDFGVNEQRIKNWLSEL
ncbi:DUF1499 domain-containing protein [uncultured Kiloniella sp.]|uniref:DUF1499 domain-containing protein n=1 Tax=uncultured Kiloniella sp. TaxID=1133091 RepID=UPI00260C5A6A|nr:DUF1499 domain-containing protein [uncultured Kiloniella sp.]